MVWSHGCWAADTCECWGSKHEKSHSWEGQSESGRFKVKERPCIVSYCGLYEMAECLFFFLFWARKGRRRLASDIVAGIEVSVLADVRWVHVCLLFATCVSIFSSFILLDKPFRTLYSSHRIFVAGDFSPYSRHHSHLTIHELLTISNTHFAQ